MIRRRARPVLPILAAALAAGGCGGAGPSAAPVATDGVEAVSLGPALPLAASVWPAAGAPRAAMLALHGFGDHADNAFAEAAPAWAAAGITVYAYDQRGFGRNPSRGAWPGEGALVGDFAAAARAVAAAHPGLPLIALGHSMGGGVAVAAVGEGRAPDVDALVLAAPAIAGGPAIRPGARAATEALAAAIPDRRWTGEGIVRIQASDNIELLRRMAADPLYLRGASFREIRGLVRLLDRATAAAEGVRVPTLVLLGARDEVTPRRPIGRVAGRFGGPVDITTYPEGWHLLFGDLARDRPIADVAAWALARADAVAAAANP